MNKQSFLSMLCAGLMSLTVSAQTGDTGQNAELTDFAYRWTADKGNGTYVNPILNTDFPDPDVIRVDDTYYMVTTTMFVFPGATILKSKDLVNWEYCCNPLTQIENTDEYNLTNGKNKYASGQWASSLQYHDGKFYIHFIADFSGSGYLLTSTSMEGKWTLQKVRGYYDNGLLFDDGPNGTGKTYIAYGNGTINVSEINSKWEAVKTEKAIVADSGCEGAHMYHIGEYYYIYATYAGEGSQTIFRSKSPFGPYEEHKGRLFANQRIHQGALVQTQTGEWWTILFKDTFYCGLTLGRVPYLEPVKWVDGWPVIGNNGVDVSKGGKAYKKPDVGAEHPITYLPTNDSFSQPELGKQWGWNHNPVSRRWSLTARPGWMRLTTSYTAKNLTQARNTLTQRVQCYSPEGTAISSVRPSYGTACFDVSEMKPGDVCGLALFQNFYGYIGVKMDADSTKHIVQYVNSFNGELKEAEKIGPELKSDTVYLRAVCRFNNNNTANYYYSFDNQTFTKFGTEHKLSYTLDVFVGYRFALFNYATKKVGGWVDIDWFTTEARAGFAEKNYFTEEYLYPESLFPDGNPTAVEAVAPADSRRGNGKTEYYNLQGMRSTTPHRGLNIVRRPDGTVTKMWSE